jgi:hypothetical protein
VPDWLYSKGCPLGILQRGAGDNVPMFELWLGPKLAPFGIPYFAVIAGGGLALLMFRRPAPASV